MKYIALLRGINVGGNFVIKMAELIKLTESCGFTNVRTYIQSGNIMFESPGKDAGKIISRLEECYAKNFKFNQGIVVLSYGEFKAVANHVPAEWKSRNDLRCYIAFVRKPATPQDVMAEIKPKEGVDFVKAGPGVVYMYSLLSGITRTGFTKLAGTPAYKAITMRNYNTVQKLLELIQSQ